MRDSELLREAASLYTEKTGSELLDELAKLDSCGNAESLSLQRLERNVKSRIAAIKRRRVLPRALSALVACIALAVLLPQLINSRVPVPPPAPSSAYASASPATPAETIPPSSAVIPLSAKLPVGFTQTASVQDNEKSIYYIDDLLMDDVVITLEKSPSQPAAGDLKATHLGAGAQTAYCTQNDAYSLLTFTRGGILYTLTCRYDVNTLVRLGNALITEI